MTIIFNSTTSDSAKLWESAAELAILGAANDLDARMIRIHKGVIAYRLSTLPTNGRKITGVAIAEALGFKGSGHVKHLVSIGALVKKHGLSIESGLVFDYANQLRATAKPFADEKAYVLDTPADKFSRAELQRRMDAADAPKAKAETLSESESEGEGASEPVAATDDADSNAKILETLTNLGIRFANMGDDLDRVNIHAALLGLLRAANSVSEVREVA